MKCREEYLLSGYLEKTNEAYAIAKIAGIELCKFYHRQLTLMVKEVVGFDGNIVHDTSNPDGTFRKLLDIRKLHTLEFKHKTSLKQGIIAVYNWYLNKQ